MKALSRTLSRLITGGFSILMPCTLLLLLFCAGTSYRRKRDFAISNTSFLLLGVLLLSLAVLLCCLVKRRWPRLQDTLERRADLFVMAGTAVLFFLLLYLIYCYYFRTEWDVKILLDAANALRADTPQAVNTTYFSRYPNNILLVVLFSAILRLDGMFGMLDVQNGIMGLVAVQILLCVVTGLLLYRLIKKLSGSPWTALLGWMVFLAMVALSPWLSIPYSDATGLIFPVAVFSIYSGTDRQRFVPLRWFFMVLLSYIGYKIKPQLAFALVAVVAVECTALFAKTKKELLRHLRILPAAGAALLLGVSLVHACVGTMDVTLNENRQVGPAHFFMMGLNPESNGSYQKEDVMRSDAMATPKKRTQMNIETSKQRLQTFGTKGLARHLIKKTLVNYNDGTFAWGQEAGKHFFDITYPDKNQTVSPFMKSLYYTNGSNFALFLNGEQLLWIGTLAGMCFAWLYHGTAARRLKKRTGAVARQCVRACMLSIVGLTLFQLLFEARARYLFCYVPIYILLGTTGWKSLFDVVRARVARPAPKP